MPVVGPEVGTDAMWLDLTLTLSRAGVGFACGWVVRAVDTAAARGQRRVGGPASATASPSKPDFSRGQTSEVAARLRGEASRMAADVDVHQTRVQAVND